MISNLLKVYTSPLPKTRYGNNQDGGYVGVKTSTDILLSGGIGANISFELDFPNQPLLDEISLNYPPFVNK